MLVGFRVTAKKFQIRLIVREQDPAERGEPPPSMLWKDPHLLPQQERDSSEPLGTGPGWAAAAPVRHRPS